MPNANASSVAEWTRQIQASSGRPLPPGVRESLQHGSRHEIAAKLPRRALLGLLATIGGGLAFGLSREVRADSCTPTPVRQAIEGPYYLGDPEERNDTGTGVIIKGDVLDAITCLPIADATIVRWHANGAGFYEEFYRAQMITKADGLFQLSTIQPGQYAGLARHIHWFVTAPGYKSITDQIQWNDNVTIPSMESFHFSMYKA